MDMFSALGEPTRRSIVELLASNGKLSASDISRRYPVSAPAISQHLKVLRDADVVTVEKKAQKRLYSINPKKVDELDMWVRKLKDQWELRLDRLEKLLQK